MAEIAARDDSERRTRMSFFVWIGALCVFFAFGGFTPTYFAPMASGSLRSLNPAVHIHGILFFAWTLLLLLQSTLVASRKVALHRSLGLIGISLASAMVIFGAIVNLSANGARIEAGEIDRGYAFGLIGISQVFAFGIMFAIAIRNISRKDYHRRWMLFATTMILPAAVARLYFPLFGFGQTPTWVTLATVNIVPIACVIYDLRTQGRLHNATIIGVPIIVFLQIAARSLDESSVWRITYDGLLSLMGN